MAISEQVALGGFRLGDMALALPMCALREVSPCSGFHTLPCAAPAVVGGIELRGVMVPVLDLRRLLGRAAAEVRDACVVVMVHEGRILGLLADAVTGIFSCEKARLHPVPAGDGLHQRLYSATLQREDDGNLVSLLDPAVFANLPDVPLVADPEPARNVQLVVSRDGGSGTVVDDAVDAATRALRRTVILLRCGASVLALDASVVHTTVSVPTIEHSALAMGHCKGVIEYAGVKVPIVDLHALCGMGGAVVGAGAQAFLLSLPEGLVAFLVQEVLDVICVPPEVLIRVPRFALPRADLFDCALSHHALPGELRERLGQAGGQVLLIDSQGLKACGDLQALSRANVSVLDGQTVRAEAMGAHGHVNEQVDTRVDVLTYVLGGETGSLLSQVSEILPLNTCIPGHEGRPAHLLGFMVNQGRSIPVLCLQSLMRHAPTLHVTGGVDTACVLVVQCNDEWVGFAVPRLVGIETAVPVGRVGQTLVRVGQGDNERILGLIDLQSLACQVCAG